VLNLFETHPIELYHLTLVTADGRRERLGTTGNHPFYEASERRFVPARELRPGCRVVTVTGAIAEVEAVEIHTAAAGESFTTYNIEVEEDHTYHVGELGTWVHNLTKEECLALVKRVADGDETAILPLRKGLAEKPELRKLVPEEWLRRVDAGNGSISANGVHARFVNQVRPGARERVFDTPWSKNKGLGSRKFDDFDDLTKTGFEGNTTPWSQMTQEQLSRKLDQVGSDFALLQQRNGPVKRIIWFGTEELPMTGLGGQLCEALQKAGIRYWVVK
jgi:hypothetical protein